MRMPQQTPSAAAAGRPSASPGDDRLSWRDRLAADGYAVLRGAVSAAQVAAAVRLLNLAIRRHGLSAEDIVACQQTTFFPHLRWEPEVWALLPPVAAEVLGWRDGDEWAEPQLLLRFPDEEQPWRLQPHVDEPPPWAAGRSYRGIVGVALTPVRGGDGAPCVWPASHRGSTGPLTGVALEAGDALLMHPALAHCGSLNLGGQVRIAVYFRLLAGSGPQTASSMSMTTRSREG